ncbi:MAG TPA: dephospho-CoA kinase, partial [Lachnospiraceae bacterium]|nr:dephospho-CoA kinase [Lachnospiraceae bacterium]
EAALLIEDKYDEICDELWYIYAGEEIRRERLKKSRGYSDEKIDSIFASQLSEEVFRSHCDVIIDNSGVFSQTKEQIRQRMQSYETM